jgi:hypothetical protein
MLADEIHGMTPSSSPHLVEPIDSPTSALRSIRTPACLSIEHVCNSWFTPVGADLLELEQNHGIHDGTPVAY